MAHPLVSHFDYRFMALLDEVQELLRDVPLRRRPLDEYNIEIGAGLGLFQGQVWRIGLMGHSVRKENVVLLLAGLKKCLPG